MRVSVKYAQQIVIGIAVFIVMAEVTLHRDGETSKAIDKTIAKLRSPKNEKQGEIRTTNEDWPPLSSLIGDMDKNITGDVQFLLQFAIIGFPKCGTSTLMRLLANEKQVQMYHKEIRSLKNGHPAELVKILYDLPQGSEYIRGFKDPVDIISWQSFPYFQKLWPKTKLIVGVRHPIKLFESWVRTLKTEEFLRRVSRITIHHHSSCVLSLV
jgi:hypothetical protein